MRRNGKIVDFISAHMNATWNILPTLVLFFHAMCSTRIKFRKALLFTPSLWYNVYVKARNDIKETGVSFLSSRGDYRPHPSFSAMNTASSQIQKLLSTFAASPYQKSKMKSLDRQGGKIFDESEYVQNILNN